MLKRRGIQAKQVSRHSTSPATVSPYIRAKPPHAAQRPTASPTLTTKRTMPSIPSMLTRVAQLELLPVLIPLVEPLPAVRLPDALTAVPEPEAAREAEAAPDVAPTARLPPDAVDAALRPVAA